jgi:hypothetical protein
MCRNKILDTLEIIAAVHEGEKYPSCQDEIDAITDLIWCEVLGRINPRLKVELAVTEYFEKRMKHDN